jgi:hypothetical protein
MLDGDWSSDVCSSDLGSFPWVWFAPVLLALRYGPLVGLGSVTVVFLIWLSIGSIDQFPQAFLSWRADPGHGGR